MNVINSLARVEIWLCASAVLLESREAAQARPELELERFPLRLRSIPRNNAPSLRAGTLED
jgi:hypothetical protein